MAKTTIEQLISASGSFDYLISRRERLSGKVNYQLSKNIKPVKDELDAYNEARKGIIKKYANKDENGEPVIISNEYDIPKELKKEFDAEIDELMNTEVDIQVKMIKLDDLESAGLSAADYFNLDYMIEE